MFDKIKKLLIPSKLFEDYNLQYEIAIANHKLSLKCKYDMFTDMLKDNGYLIDHNIQLTEKDTEFIQTYDVEIRMIEGDEGNRKFITNVNDTVMTLTVPGDNNQVIFISRGKECVGGYTHKLDIEHYPKSDSLDNFFIIEIIKYAINTQQFRHITFSYINYCIIFDKTGIQMETGNKLIWNLRFPPYASPIQVIDIDIKKELIKYTGEWDICVHKDAKDKFSWWKDGKYIRCHDSK